MRAAVATLVALLLAAGSPAGIARAESAPLDSVASVAITVQDAARSTAFFRDVLGFTVASQEKTVGARWAPSATGLGPATVELVHLELGGTRVDLADWVDREGAAYPADSRSNDLWYEHVGIAVSDMKAAVARLEAAGVRPISEAPQVLPASNPGSAGIEVYCFRDPDGHPMELVHYPKGKGDARWQAPGHGVFLGVDHVALVVSDLDESVKFYAGRLGMSLAWRGDHSGPEQQGLFGVPGASLRVAGLREKHGPAVELLQYLEPKDGRPRPRDARANDLLVRYVVLGDSTDPGARLAVMSDPDGHLVKSPN